MAMSPQEREERRKTKAARLKEQDLRLKVHTESAGQLEELMGWAEIKESSEALTLLIYNAKRIGQERFKWFTAGSQLQIEQTKVPPSSRIEIRLRARPGTVNDLDQLGTWLGPADRSFTARLLIEKTHALGPIQALTMLRLPPRHKFVLRDSVARSLDQYRLGRELRQPAVLLDDYEPEASELCMIEYMQSALGARR